MEYCLLGETTSHEFDRSLRNTGGSQSRGPASPFDPNHTLGVDHWRSPHYTRLVAQWMTHFD
jgi:hypothetical protein